MHNVLAAERHRPIHFLESYTELLRREFGVPLTCLYNLPLLYLSEEEKELKPAEPYWIITRPGAKRDYTVKRWSNAALQKVVDLLPDRKWIQVGLAKHEHKALNGVVDMIGKTSIRELIVLAYHAQGIVTGESFLWHVGNALGIPTVCISSAWINKQWVTYPQGLLLNRQGCYPCCQSGPCLAERVASDGTSDSKNNRLCSLPVLVDGEYIPQCTHDITPEEVVSAIKAYKLDTSPPKRLAFNFGTSGNKKHGLGDVVCMALIQELYRRRGYDYYFQTSPDRQCLFGDMPKDLPIVGNHAFNYPPALGDWKTIQKPLQTSQNAPEWNKIGYNLSSPPLADIGTPSALWEEMKGIRLQLDISPSDRQLVENYVARMPRPLILIHPYGHTSPSLKDLTKGEVAKLVSLLPTSVVLDWKRGTDWTVPQLVHLLGLADLLIAIDSGLAHLVRYTDTPCICIWKNHYPSFFALPRKETINVAGIQWRDIDKLRGEEWNTRLINTTDMEAISLLARSILDGNNNADNARTSQDFYPERLPATRELVSQVCEVV